MSEWRGDTASVRWLWQRYGNLAPRCAMTFLPGSSHGALKCYLDRYARL